MWYRPLHGRRCESCRPCILRLETCAAATFTFNPYQHDDTPKTFMGHTGNWNGDDIVDILVAHPATARRLCTKIFEFIAYPNPEPAVVTALVQTYYDSGYDIRSVVSRILHSNAFYSDKARYAIIKCPVQYAIGTVKMLGLASSFQVQPADITPTNDMAANPGGAQPSATGAQRLKGQRLGGLAFLPNAMRSMGQDLLEPPSVKGWDGGETWINTSTLLARIDFAGNLSLSRRAFDGSFIRATAFVRQNNWDAAGWVDYLAETLGPLPLTPQTRQALIDYVNSPDDAPVSCRGRSSFTRDSPTIQPALATAADQPLTPEPRLRLRRKGGPLTPPPGPGGIEGRLRGVIPLIMATPEYQVC